MVQDSTRGLRASSGKTCIADVYLFQRDGICKEGALVRGHGASTSAPWVRSLQVVVFSLELTVHVCMYRCMYMYIRVR